MFGHRLGVGTFGAGPDSGLVNDLGHRLHAGRRQLDPANTRRGGEGLGETPHVVRIEPDQGLGVIGQAHHRPATSLDAFDGKGGGIWRDGHPRWRHIGTLPSYGSGTAISPVTTPLQSAIGRQLPGRQRDSKPEHGALLISDSPARLGHPSGPYAIDRSLQKGAFVGRSYRSRRASIRPSSPE